MKRILSLVLSLTLTAALLFAVAAPANAVNAQEKQLQFNEDGKFTILQIADTQDIFIPLLSTIEAINRALDKVQPDLVVFTGDNITGGGCFTKSLTKTAIDAIVEPVAKRGIPFTLVFGNHDDEGSVDKDTQFSMYQKYDNCIAYDAVPELYGTGTHNLTIRNSAGTQDVYNLWLIDSGSYNEDLDVGGYDYVHQDQIDWYVNTSNALKAANGGNVLSSLVFQHIPVPEIYEVYKAVAPGTEGSRDRFGGTWALELNPDMASGALHEWSCPPNVNSGEFAAMVAQGDVKGIVTGHDHVNSFVGTYQGIDFIQSPGIGYSAYGDDSVRGVRVITLDENDTSTYETQVITNIELFGSKLNVTLYNTVLGSYFGYLVSAFLFVFKSAFQFLGGVFA